jgi:hypothetical protein
MNQTIKDKKRKLKKLKKINQKTKIKKKELIN